MNNLPENYEKPNARQQNISKFLNYLAIAIILLGVFVRLVQYFSHRSLWGDEAYIALNIGNRSYLELLQPLDYNQAAPPGFLWIEKLATQLFGDNEYSLRLFPLIAGIISLIAFYKLGKWAVSPLALPIALILFACLKYPIYFTTEVKQYSSDVMVALLLCLLLIPLHNQILKARQVFLIGILGVIAIWLSHPAIFVLAGIESTTLLTASAEKRKAILINRFPAYLMWIITFGAIFFLITSKAMKNDVLQNAWGPEYPESIFNLIWLLDSLGRVVSRPLGFPVIAEVPALLALAIGGTVLFRKNRLKFIILISPIVATLMATYLHKYPFRSRLILFLCPFFILIIAEGLALIVSQFNKLSHFNKLKNSSKSLIIVGIIVVGLAIIPSVLEAGELVVAPKTVQEIRPVLEYIKTHQQPGDKVYVHFGTGVYQFKYYVGKFGYSESDYVIGYNSFLDPGKLTDQKWEDFRRQFSQLKPKQRVWFLFSGLRLSKAKEVLAEPRLNRLGKQLDFFYQRGAFTYLYQLK